MKISIETNIDVNGTVQKVEDPAFWYFAATEYHRLITPYVPRDTGALNETVRYNSDKLSGEIEYYAPYAHYQYEGKAMGKSFYIEGVGFRSPKGQPKYYTGKPLTYHHGGGSKWDEAAEATQKPKLIDALQAYVDSGRLNLS